MSREFNGSSQYIEAASPVLTSVPLTMACWFNSDSITATQTLVQISDVDQSNKYFSIEALGTVGGDPLRCFVRNGGLNGIAVSSTGYSADTWHHACGVFTAVDDRDIYIDGGGNVNNTDSVANPSTLSHTILGVGHQGGSFVQYFNGEIAEVAIWTVALTAEEVAALAAGYSPLLVQPDRLALYMPLVREIHDIVGRIGMSNTGTTVTDHPAILTPVSPQLVPAAPGVLLASQRLKVGHGR